MMRRPWGSRLLATEYSDFLFLDIHKYSLYGHNSEGRPREFRPHSKFRFNFFPFVPESCRLRDL